MLFFFRYLPHLCKRVALSVALVFFLLATVGQAFHYLHHVTPTNSAASVVSAHEGRVVKARHTSTAALPAWEQPEGFCAMCDWEKIPTTAAAPLAPFVFFLTFGFLLVSFTEKPSFLVRQILALRESRGPPCFAAA